MTSEEFKQTFNQAIEKADSALDDPENAQMIDDAIIDMSHENPDMDKATLMSAYAEHHARFYSKMLLYNFLYDLLVD